MLVYAGSGERAVSACTLRAAVIETTKQSLYGRLCLRPLDRSAGGTVASVVCLLSDVACILSGVSSHASARSSLGRYQDIDLWATRATWHTHLSASCFLLLHLDHRPPPFPPPRPALSCLVLLRFRLGLG